MAYSKNRRLAEIVSDTSGNLSVEGIVVPTQSSSDNDTSAASTAFVHAHIDAVLDSAPGTLNTLNEIAAALNDDANFNTTISNAIAAKLPLAGGTLTGNLGIGVSASSAIGVYHSQSLANGLAAELTNTQSSTGSGIVVKGGNNSSTYSADFRDHNNNTLMRIRGDGNVGIGTQSPFSRVQSGGHTFSGSHGMHANSRVGISNHGTLTGMMLASTYNDASHPEYGLVFVQGPSTSSYNVWSISPDGPAKGNGLNFHYGSGVTNIHQPANFKIVFKGDGKVGIGTSSPEKALHIRSASNQLRLQDSTNDKKYDLNVDGSNFSIDDMNAGASRFTIKDGGNVGIGETNPDASLHITSNTPIISFDESDASQEYRIGSFGGAFALYDSTDSAYRLIVDGSGKVIIGDTASHVDDLLQIETPASGGGHGIQIRRNDSNGDQGIGRIMFGNNNDTDLATISSVTDGQADCARLVFSTQPTSGNSTERMRIDSVGNLLVGTTSTTVGAGGSGVKGFRVDGTSGIVQAAASANISAIFNRTTNDGAIVSLRKNGTQNGVLATAGGDLVVGSHNTCFRFDDSADDILPTDDAGVLVDNTLVLGASNARFKEIYLSNGINFSANANASGMSSEILDDYEEGVFDAAITPGSGSYTLNSAYSKLGYTRIGRVVTITGMVVISGASGASGSVTIGDLPFEMLNGTQRSSQTRPSIHIYANGSGAPASAYYSAFIAFNEGNRSGTLIVTHNNTHDATPGDWLAGGSDLFINFSYHAAD